MKRILLPLLLATPSLLPAQSTTLSTYVAADAAVRGTPVVLGASVGREAGVLGVRWSGEVDAASTLGAEPQPLERPEGLFTTEVDALLIPVRAGGALPVTPYAFAGVGGRWVRDQGATAAGMLWSYGGGARLPVAGPLALEGEARRREPLGATPDEMPAGTTPGWELRLGFHLGFGGRAAARPAARVPVAVSRPLPSRSPAPLAGEAVARDRVALRAIDTADDFLGTRYTWGGNTPDEGFDCSGFVRFVFARHGIDLPRVSRDQARAGTPLPLDVSRFQPGDLLAFSSDGGEVDHIAIYAGEGRIIHSSASGKGVRYDDLSSPQGRWFLEHMVAARRVIGDPLAAGWSAR